MDTFLDLTAKKILSQYHPEALEKLCVVFPSRRAGVFFRKSLSRQVGEAFFMPEIFAMEDFVLKNTNLRQLDSISLSFELFEVHKKLNKNSGSFEEFLKYGTTILSDFNELDMHMVDIQKAFSYLEDYRELKLWGLEKDELSDFQKKYLDFFKSLSYYYEEFKKRLFDRKSAYQGLAFRYLAENCDEIFREPKWKKTFFAGFNAFTPSEQKIVDFFLENQSGEVIWNADKYYLEDKKQEAGQHLRELFKKDFYVNDFVGNNFRDYPKDIDIYGCPGDIAQAKTAGQLLKSISEEDNVAVVLADETLLEPVLNSIPSNISAFNVTMGLPLGNTPLYSLFENLFRLHVSPYKTGKSKKAESGDIYFYYKDVLRVMAHSLIKKYLDWKMSDYENPGKSPIDELKKANKTYYSPRDIKKLLSDIGVRDMDAVSFLWEDWQQKANKALDSYLHLLQALRDMAINQDSREGENQLLLEYIYRFSNVFQTMQNLREEYSTLKTPDVLWRFLIQLINRETIAFRGEPLKGLQIMGMLETRLLDFERVILVSANEEFLPGGQFDVTLMPYEMRLNYRLPLKKDKAAIFAYHFYSLLQRSKKVDILYNTVIEGNQGSEMSRFVKQLMHELPKYNRHTSIRNTNVAIKPHLKEQEQKIEIEKSAKVMKRLKEKADTGFAATTLNKYRLCPLKYYLEEILNLEEEEEVEETIEARTLGNVVHHTLEKFFKPFINKAIKKEDLVAMEKEAQTKLTEVFKELYTGRDIFSGKNLLVYNVALYWLEAFLKKEKEDLKAYQEKGKSYFLKGTETQLWGHLSIQQPYKNFRVNFKGKIDRMDKVGEDIRIIDYKTGRVINQNITFDNFEQLMESTGKKEAFQLLIYQWLYRQNYNDGTKVWPAILSFPALNNGYMFAKHAGKKGVENEALDDFEKEIEKLLEEIFDSKIPFYQTKDREICRTCDFKDLCNRHN
ncbi:MAG: PD-(D/E)XK nuclease family protein [Bacteroidales bacterium]|nr:PD-(D/E)XK nuclease family protein [Bacteroidales bacterium]MCF8336757.1 PD-(D/E)XK nuclease family protein [Bacteroidales bacterium]